MLSILLMVAQIFLAIQYFTSQTYVGVPELMSSSIVPDMALVIPAIYGFIELIAAGVS